MLRPNSVGQRRIVAIVAPLALVLSMGISHQALAACTPANASLEEGDTVTCNGTVEGFLARIDPTLHDGTGSASNKNLPGNENAVGSLTVNIEAGAVVDAYYSGASSAGIHTTANGTSGTTSTGSRVSMPVYNDDTNAVAVNSYSVAVLVNEDSLVNVFNGGTVRNIDGGQPGNKLTVDSVNVGVQLGGDGSELHVHQGGVVTASMSATKIGDTVTTTVSTMNQDKTGADTTGKKKVVTTDQFGATGAATDANMSTAEKTVFAAGDHSTTTTAQSAANTAAVFGVNTDQSGEYKVLNEGTISVSHQGIGRAFGIFGGGATEGMTVENHGLISATRDGSFSKLVDNNSGNLRGIMNDKDGVDLDSLTPQSIGNVAGIFVEEELEEVTIKNYGTIQTNGPLATTIYLRAGESVLKNYGVIEDLNAGGQYGRGIAIAATGNVSELTVDNEEGAVIRGDMVIANANALRYWAIKKQLTADGTGYEFLGAAGTGSVDSALNITSQAGVAVNSEIENEGEIDGDWYYANGEHELVNAGLLHNTLNFDGRANIDVDQRPTANGVTGSKDFSLEMDGTTLANLTVRTVAGSEVTLKPHIYGGGADDDDDAPDANASAYLDGKLKIWDGSASTLKNVLEVHPVIDSLVKSGEWYTVATQVDDTAGNVDDVEVESGFMVEWEARKNASGAFVIGAEVKDAAEISGLSNPGISTVNALMQGGSDETNELGGAFQMLDEDEARKAGEQLSPETNFATQQAALTLNMMTGNYIDNRLAGVGATSSKTAGFAAPSGLGMSGMTSAAPAGRMSLGLGTDDGRMNIGANDGRMDAGMYDEDVDLRQRGYSSALWGQVFGAGLDQGERSNVDGYQTHIYGALAGADTWISSNTRLGFAAGYGNTSIDGSGDTAQNKTDIDSYLGVVYGAYKGQGWYLSTRAGYTWHDYSTTRVIQAFSDAATGSHSGNQYSAAGEVGIPLHSYGGTLTPVASLSWSQLDQDGYQETSGAGTGLTIGSQQTTSLASGLGAKALIPIDQWSLLEGRAIWYHEFEDTNQQVTAAFDGGASFLASGPNVGRDTAAVGVGLFAAAGPGVSFQLNYDALLRQDFIGHTGSGRVKMEF